LKTIAFLLSHPSHQISSLNVAKKLADHGYNVVYIGPCSGADNEDLVYVPKTNGFTFIELDIYHSERQESKESISNIDIKFNRFVSNLIDITIYRYFF